ncbi:MAG: 23S rRNA (adenine(2503)-C(2))-methyltransferase RlmN, partial [Patescibacteria group bacterium]
QLMPIANSYNLKELFDALSGYLRAKGRKVMFEYMMIAGVNDSPARAEELAELLKSLPRNLIMVNLIPHNPVGKFKPSPMLAVKKFRDILFRNGIETTIRKSWGGEIAGACGQLAGKGKNDVRQSAE